MGFKRKYTRAWLNRLGHPDRGYVITSIVEDSYDVTAEVVIADCARSVALDFTFATEQQKRARLKKVQLLISELTNFAVELESAQPPKKRN